MRLDKFLCDMAGLTRSDAKKAVSHGDVCVNGVKTKSPNAQINTDSDSVTYKGKTVIYEEFVYFMLNKPAGIVSANTDTKDITVIDLFKGENRKNLSCVGRLDKDTTGLLLVTDDGELVHKLTSPKKSVFKDYFVTIDHPLSADDINNLEGGVDINDDAPTRPARVKVLSDKEIVLSICEGRFHQVKRMLMAVNNEVKALKRLSVGPVLLDEALNEGEYRRLTPEEIKSLKNME